MFDDLTNNFEIEYFAGGATQNALRYCQWVVGVNRPATTFVGAIGNDYFGKIMEKGAKTDGVNVKYQVVEKNTGTCLVLFSDSGKSRTLCAYLGIYSFNLFYILLLYIE
jgi:adenosine kinase